MNESKIKEFLDSWTKGVIEIGKAYLKKGDFEREALKFLSKHYACLLYTSPSPRDNR